MGKMPPMTRVPVPMTLDNMPENIRRPLLEKLVSQLLEDVKIACEYRPEVSAYKVFLRFPSYAEYCSASVYVDETTMNMLHGWGK
jgi:hypothetical protein